MDKSNKSMTALTELFLFCGARAQHVEEFIKPALDSGKHVISDRFDASTVAYQLYGRNQIINLLDDFSILNNIAKKQTEPDVIIWLDVSPKIGLSRKEQSHEGIMTRFDEEKTEFHRRVREGFKTCFENNNFDSPISPIWHQIITDNVPLDIVQKKTLHLIEKILNS